MKMRAALLGLMGFLSVAPGFAARPQITLFEMPSRGTLMESVRITAAADGLGDSRGLVFSWSILRDETRSASLKRTTGTTNYLDLWWPSAAEAESLIGAQVAVQLTVSFENADENDEAATLTRTLVIDSVNHPPIPVIKGNTGTSRDRITAGKAVQLSSSPSSDPDGDRFHSRWALGTKKGGKYYFPPVLYGTDGTMVAFTVPDMSSVVEQTVVLTLLDGLHEINSQVVVYLAPSATTPPPSTGGGSPVLSVPQPSVTVSKGAVADLQVSAVDSEGDDLRFSWVFTQSGTTASSSLVSSRRVSTDSWVSVLSYPTSVLAPGTYQFTVQAIEVGKIVPKSSEKKYVSLVVAPAGSATGLTQERAVCGSNAAPSLTYIDPDPEKVGIQLAGGTASQFEVAFRDYSEAFSFLGGTRKGIDNIVWDLTGAQAIGIDGTSQLLATADPYEGRSILELTPAVNSSGTVTLRAVATDVEGCTNTISFDIKAVPTVQNQKPVAKIKYNSGSGYSGAVTNGTVVEVQNRQVELDGSLSTDDGGSGNLQYRWTVDSGATLSSATGVRTTLTLNEGLTGSVNVTLTVTDSGSLSDSADMVFKLKAPNQAPVARLRYNDGKLFASSVADGATVESPASEIQLDATQSSDDKGIASLAFNWSVAGGGALSAKTGQTTKVTMPAAAGSEVTVTLKVTDQEGASNSLTARFKKTVQNQAPTAKLRYDAGSGAVDFPSSGGQVETSVESIQLDAGQSSDDRDQPAALTYLWALSGKGSLSGASGVSTTLTMPAEVGTQATVTLTVRDSGNLTATYVATFQRMASNQAPVAKLKYSEGSGAAVAAENGATVETAAATVQLDAGQSTDDQGNDQLSFAWQLNGMGALSASSGATTVLTLPTTAGSQVSVTLTVRDQAELAGTVTVTFKKMQSNQAPVAAVKYLETPGGAYQGPFTENTSKSAASRSITLDASTSSDDGAADSLAYSWGVSGISGAAVSPTDQAVATLVIPAKASGTATVTLTVTDAEGLADSVSVALQFAAPAEAPVAKILSCPESVEAGNEFEVGGSAGGGNAEGSYSYHWSAESSDGEAGEVFSTGSRALVFAPGLETLDPVTVTVSLVVYKGDVASEAVTADVEVTPPTLYFAQLAVGDIDALLTFQTTVVLVNNSDVPAEGQVSLLANGKEDGWHVMVDGELRNGFDVKIPAGGAKKFVLTGRKIEAGWLKLVSNIALTGHLFYQVKHQGNDRIVREVPILANFGQGFRTALDEGSNESVALALVNVGDQLVRFTLEVTGTDGGVMQTREFTLEPGLHQAQFLNQFFDGKGNSVMMIPESFIGGTLVIRVIEGGDLAAAIIKTDGGLPLSILPVASW